MANRNLENAPRPARRAVNRVIFDMTVWEGASRRNRPNLRTRPHLGGAYGMLLVGMPMHNGEYAISCNALGGGFPSICPPDTVVDVVDETYTLNEYKLPVWTSAESALLEDAFNGRRDRPLKAVFRVLKSISSVFMVPQGDYLLGGFVSKPLIEQAYGIDAVSKITLESWLDFMVDGTRLVMRAHGVEREEIPKLDDIVWFDLIGPPTDPR